MTLLEAMADANLFRPWFKEPQTWAAWRALLSAVFALPMSPEQLAIYQRHTGRLAPPTKVANECWLICGRRAGKSFILALVAVYLACFFDHRKHLAPGERATILVIATNTQQARVILRYVRALLLEVPMLRKLVGRETAHAFDLQGSVTLEVHPASFRAIRGYAVAAAVLDELAFWPTDDAAQPDFEILNALRPGMATIPNAMLLCASSPYARRGALWDAYRRHYGKDGDPVLVWKSDTRSMNCTVLQQVIDEATERDPQSALAEFGGEFRTDIESFINREAVEACVSDVRERPPMAGQRYFGFVDPSGGSSDSMTCAVGHKEGDVVYVDAVREVRPPFSPEDVVIEFALLLKAYGVNRCVGDKYAGLWPQELFLKHHIVFEQSAKPKSDLYRDMLPLINSRRIDLLDHPRLISQLCSLERRTARGGRDSIDHPPGGHDDVCNSVAGLAASAVGGRYRYPHHMDWVAGGPEVDAEAKRAAEAKQFLESRYAAHLSRYGGRR
jgi:hypothetical protein